MNAGIETDSLIARKVWKAIVVNDFGSGESYLVEESTRQKVPIPSFSTDIDEAHKIVEFFQNLGWFFRVQSVPFEDSFRGSFYKNDGRTYIFQTEATMPLVICAAALALLDGSNLKK